MIPVFSFGNLFYRDYKITSTPATYVIGWNIGSKKQEKMSAKYKFSYEFTIHVHLADLYMYIKLILLSAFCDFGLFSRNSLSPLLPSD